MKKFQNLARHHLLSENVILTNSEVDSAVDVEYDNSGHHNQGQIHKVHVRDHPQTCPQKASKRYRNDGNHRYAHYASHTKQTFPETKKHNTIFIYRGEAMLRNNCANRISVQKNILDKSHQN